MDNEKHLAKLKQGVRASGMWKEEINPADLGSVNLHGLDLLRDLIQERTGLFFRDYQGLEVIASKLTPRLEKSGCGSFSEYYRLLSKEGITAANEWLHVLAGLSKSISSFWRRRKETQTLVDTVIPQWLLNGGAETLKIWSTGCATGEEPLTIAMALSESGWFDRIRIQLYGSDASFAAIEKAQRGIYSESRMEVLSPELRSKYFTPVTQGWQVRPELHEKIQWSVTNLMSGSETAEFATSHIIFCCNVFIYFSARAICQTLRLFGTRMPAGGYLFTDKGDYFESLMSRIGFFERQKFSDVSIWMKPVGKSTIVSTTDSAERHLL
ncbi:MAG: CheR family methyltransferase [Blastocatellia bacterium]